MPSTQYHYQPIPEMEMADQDSEKILIGHNLQSQEQQIYAEQT